MILDKKVIEFYENKIRNSENLIEMRFLLLEYMKNYPDEYYCMDFLSLPTFGTRNEEFRYDWNQIYSWDDEHFLIFTDGGWKIILRTKYYESRKETGYSQ